MIRVPGTKPFNWIFADHRNQKHQTIRVLLEYEVIDRQFLVSIFERNTPRDEWSWARPANPEQFALAKAQLTPEEMARCTAESINPSIWARAKKVAEQRRSIPVNGAVLTLGDGTQQELTNARLEILRDRIRRRPRNHAQRT